MKYFLQLAQANYNCEAYGEFAYNECASSSSTPGDPQDSGGLPNTGYDIMLPLALAGALLIASAILATKRLTRRHAKQ